MANDNYLGTRLHKEGSPDKRDPYERDRDRILYSSYFHRLAGITQIVRAGEADYFHTRQQHTLKVAQVGYRLAQYCMAQPNGELWDIDPNVVEAACMAHDLGHPPFGHIGEHTLNELVLKDGNQDGFEGNAQSFRIVTKLGVRFENSPGLNLTRATLNAILKYPWIRDHKDPKKVNKWSVYESERNEFEFVRGYGDKDGPEIPCDEHQCIGAALMDWADDIAYSVHDLEDFQRAGVMPWLYMFTKDGTDSLIRGALKAWHNAPVNAESMMIAAWEGLREHIEPLTMITSELYDGSRPQRVVLRSLTSSLIGRFASATTVSDDTTCEPVVKPLAIESEVRLLKQITRDYIISTPALIAQQHGQKRIIAGLFDAIINSCGGDPPPFTPPRFRYLWKLSEGRRSRFAADFIASLTEAQATALYGRLYGTSAGSVLDPIVR